MKQQKPAREANAPYQTLRKKMHKGKMAPNGTLFIHIILKREKMKYTSTRHVMGGQTDEALEMVAFEMYNELLTKYKIK